MIKQTTDYEGETRIISRGGSTSLEPSVEYIGVVHDAKSPTERIIVGKRISSGERTCWPPVFGWQNEADGISGSLACMNFKRITFEYLEPLLREKNKESIDFSYRNQDALMISMFGIEPAGMERIRNSMSFGWGHDPGAFVLEALLNHLSKIAKERNVPLLAVENQSIYPFYPSRYDLNLPTRCIQEIYNSQETPIRFKQFSTKKGNELERVSVRKKGETEDHVCLYGVLEKTKL